MVKTATTGYIVLTRATETIMNWLSAWIWLIFCTSPFFNIASHIQYAVGAFAVWEIVCRSWMTDAAFFCIAFGFIKAIAPGILSLICATGCLFPLRFSWNAYSVIRFFGKPFTKLGQFVERHAPNGTLRLISIKALRGESDVIRLHIDLPLTISYLGFGHVERSDLYFMLRIFFFKPGSF